MIEIVGSLPLEHLFHLLVMTVIMIFSDDCYAGECQQQPGRATTGCGCSLHTTFHVITQAAHS